MNYKKYLLQRMNNKRQNKWTKSDRYYSYSIPEDVISRLLQFHVDHILIEGSSQTI